MYKKVLEIKLSFAEARCHLQSSKKFFAEEKTAEKNCVSFGLNTVRKNFKNIRCTLYYCAEKLRS
jgi:hypothetical protein